MQKNQITAVAVSLLVVKTRKHSYELDRRHVSKSGGFQEVADADNEKARKAYEAITASAQSEFFKRKGCTVARAACRVKKDGSGSLTLRATLPKARFGVSSAFRQLEGARVVAAAEAKAAKLIIVAPVVLAKAA